MKMMGMTSISYYLSWFLHYLLLYTVINVAHSLVLWSVFRQVSFMLIFINFLLFDLVLIVQSFFIQTMCTRAKVGVMMALLLFAVQFLVSFVYKSNTDKSYEMAVGVSVSPHAACILAMKEMVYAQSVEQLMDFSNTSQIINYMTINIAFVSLFLNFVFWSGLFWYF
jgi:ATP-binding cassette subfamily A (ABC1) protein 3